MGQLPYSPLFRAGEWICVSGQIGVVDGALAGSFSGQLRQALENMGKLLDADDLDVRQVAKTTVFLTDMDDYGQMNEIYTAWFGDHRPARSAVAVAGLPMGASVEIEAWLHRDL